MDSFLQSFGFMSVLVAVIGCGVYAPWLVAPLALWFVVSVAREAVKLQKKDL
jgi:Sec-independent protein secretion pathway component TatC